MKNLILFFGLILAVALLFVGCVPSVSGEKFAYYFPVQSQQEGDTVYPVAAGIVNLIQKGDEITVDWGTEKIICRKTKESGELYLGKRETADCVKNVKLKVKNDYLVSGLISVRDNASGEEICLFFHFLKISKVPKATEIVDFKGLYKYDIVFCYAPFQGKISFVPAKKGNAVEIIYFNDNGEKTYGYKGELIKIGRDYYIHYSEPTNGKYFHYYFRIYDSDNIVGYIYVTEGEKMPPTVPHLGSFTAYKIKQ